jgi:hypothetical protein
MVSISPALTEADILAELIAPDEPTLSKEVAHALLAVRFKDDAADRISDLLQKNNAGTITATERAALDKYLRVGQFVDLLQAKARLSLQSAAPDPQ